MAREDIFDLSGKVALITGGGSGIGRAYCEEIAEFGADVACNDIIGEKAQETIQLLDKHGHRAIAIKADASNEAEINNMVETTLRELGSVDIVFANATLLDTRTVRIHEMSVN